MAFRYSTDKKASEALTSQDFTFNIEHFSQVMEEALETLADIRCTLDDLRSLGIDIPDDPREIRSMGGRQRFVLFPDPDDNLLELIELSRA